MNGMIFDWEENCERILNGEGYTTSNHQFMEQAVLFRYLMDKGHTKDEIFDLWLSTDSQLLQKLKADNEEINFMFGKLWSSASRWKMTSYPPIRLFQKEIDFINSMEVLRWVKEYILTLLCIYKFFGKKWCKYDSKIKAFCFSVTSHGRERDEHKLKISECLNKYQPYEISMFDTTLSFKMTFVQDEGEEVATIKNPRHIYEVFNLIKCEKTCEQCGSIFSYNSKTIANKLCPTCSKKKRYKQQYLCHKKQQAFVKMNNMKSKALTK